jgi:hypothetical protein
MLTQEQGNLVTYFVYDKGSTVSHSKGRSREALAGGGSMGGIERTEMTAPERRAELARHATNRHRNQALGT